MGITEVKNLASPQLFLEVCVKTLDPLPGLVGLNAGFEAGQWRADQLAGHLIQWLPEFALTESERESLSHDNAVALVAKAAQKFYSVEKKSQRGEIGELLLHVAVRQVFNSYPAISKMFYKDGPNDTVLGFDAVHVVRAESDLELWLGEAKFYKDPNEAIDDIVKEIHKHTSRDYLKSEFVAIVDKIDSSSFFAEKLRQLLHPNTSLDKVFARICIPAFITYESSTLNSYTSDSDEFLKNLTIELKRHHSTFCRKQLPTSIRIYLIVLPMAQKERLVSAFDEKLDKCKSIAN